MPTLWYIGIEPPWEGEYIVTCRGASRATNLSWEDNQWTDGREYYDVIAWTFFPDAYRP